MALELSIVTPEREAFQGSVDDVVLPGVEGEFGVLERHERFLTALKIGEGRIHRDGQVLYAAVNEGFADVNAERVVVMVDTFEMAEEIDVARAEAARSRAEGRIEQLRHVENEERQLRLYELALQRAIIRIQVSHRGR